MSDRNGLTDQLQLNKEQYEVKIKHEEQENQQENLNKLQTANQQTVLQKVNNSALGNTDALPKELVMSSESLQKILSETDGDEDIVVPKEETLNIVESTLTVPIVSETINKPTYQTNKTLLDAKQGQKVKLADDTKVLEKSSEIEATRETEAKEKLEKQPEELKQNYKELLGFMKEFKDSCLQETNKGNSDLMNNVIKEVSAFESLVNSKEFSVGKQHGYIPQLVNMRNAVALYYEKNKGFKWTSKGRRRRELTKNILNKLNDWMGNMPDPILDDYVSEMEKDEHEKIRDLESSKEMYMALGSAVLKKQLEREGKTVLKEAPKEGNKDAWTEEKIREYVNADSIRYISKARSHMASSKAIEKLQPSEEERAELKKKADKKYGGNLNVDTRSFGYQFGELKLNYDGSPADEKEAEKIPKIKEGLKSLYGGDIEGMKTFIDDYIKSIMDLSLSLENLSPEQMHKKGPTLAALSDSIMSIQNMFEDNNSLAKYYLNSLSPAVRFRINTVANSANVATFLNPFLAGQNLNKLTMQLKTSEFWRESLDINKEKDFLDFLKNSPEKIDDVLIETDELHQFEKKHDYFAKAKSGQSFSSVGDLSDTTKYQYRVYEDNPFEEWAIKNAKNDIIIGDYYSSKNVNARKKARADMFLKDVPKFNFEHPELDEPICAVYQKLEDFEEKIADVVSKMKLANDQAEKDKLDGLKESLEAQRDLIIKEKDAIVEERTKNPNSPYTAYAHEAKQESAKNGFTVSPEAVAYKKIHDLDSLHAKSVQEMPEFKEAKKAINSDGIVQRAYRKKLRYVNTKDGAPATEEDMKNLEWNKAFSRAVTENNHQEKIRLLKENCQYAADLIQKVDFDRIMDVDYWLNNQDLYINLANFTLCGLDQSENSSLSEEDANAMKEFFDQKTPMMDLLDKFTEMFRAVENGLATQSETIGYKVNIKEYAEPKNQDTLLEALAEMRNQNLIETKESLAKYIASNNN